MLIRLLYQFPTWLQRLYRGIVWRMNPSSKVVYLTFDDGPIPECTPQVLDVLLEHNVKATFFMVAENAQRYPEILQRVRKEGHSVGNHTYHHLRGCKTSKQAYLQDIANASKVLKTLLFRPPHGRMTCGQKKQILQAGYTVYLWDVLTHDYNPNYTPDKMLSIVQHFTRNGSILVLHDSLKSKDRMLQALPPIIQWLQAEGYTFGTLK